MIGYAKYFDSNKTISFKVSNKKLLKKYTKIWEYNISLIGKEFDRDPVYGDNDKYIKAKIKPYGDKIKHIFKVKMYQKKIYHTNVCHW